MNESGIKRHSVVTRAALLTFTTAVILMNTRLLGSTGQGEIAWIQLGILVVTSVGGFIAGGAVVYLQKEIALRSMLVPGHVWLLCAALIGSWAGTSIEFLPAEHFWTMAGLGWMQGVIIFHGQLLLANHQIKRHNNLQLLQAGLLMMGLIIAFFGMESVSVDAFVLALAGSLGATMVVSILWLARLKNTDESITGWKAFQRMWRFGRSAQTGALLQMLTNRANLSLLARSSAGLGASGIYSIAFYGLEAMWLVPRALAPIVYTKTASETNRSTRLQATRKSLLQSLGATMVLLLIAMAMPDHWYAAIFSFQGIQPVIWALAPAAIFGAASSIIAHHLSGIGKHHWNAATSGIGLIVLLLLSNEWITTHGAVGAAWAASGAATVQCMGLIIAWWQCERA
ncbi:MAG: hypothetical protein ACO2XQ_07425 [Flavobacteriales bacterium]